MDGILLVDKPAGISSFGVVARVRRILSEQAGHKIKIGHTGTLDPFATGLLILVVGAYTKRAAEFSKLDKSYKAELTLGKTSSTGDPEGEISQKSSRVPAQTEVEQVLNKFVGQIEQTPPAFSAIKINGQRAYKLSRAGKSVEIQPRKVTIYSITDVHYEYPKLSFLTEVSSGTYIRSLAEDIGHELRVGAYLSALRRSTIGHFDIKDSIKIGEATQNQLKEVAKTA